MSVFSLQHHFPTKISAFLAGTSLKWMRCNGRLRDQRITIFLPKKSSHTRSPLTSPGGLGCWGSREGGLPASHVPWEDFGMGMETAVLLRQPWPSRVRFWRDAAGRWDQHQPRGKPNWGHAGSKRAGGGVEGGGAAGLVPASCGCPGAGQGDRVVPSAPAPRQCPRFRRNTCQPCKVVLKRALPSFLLFFLLRSLFFFFSWKPFQKADGPSTREPTRVSV